MQGLKENNTLCETDEDGLIKVSQKTFRQVKFSMNNLAYFISFLYLLSFSAGFLTLIIIYYHCKKPSLVLRNVILLRCSTLPV